jgi:PRC-barrel domain protein
MMPSWRSRAVTTVLVLALVPAINGLAEGPQQRPAGRTAIERQAVGMPLYTSDGKAIGKIVATGVDQDDQPVLVAEIEQQLGIGPEAVAIPADLLVRKQGRIELTITEAEVNARLGR